ncbi:MAG: diguanylate cyclase [Candidatus Omnitrophica bacterium]|nr:diguanylate cyclase [Candidatus Omnitrophota bacterium]
MAKIRLTLQNRITTLMIFSALLLISIFVAIQLNNQVDNLKRLNTLKARMSAIVVRENLKPALRASPDETAVELSRTIEYLKSMQVIEGLSVIDDNDTIIASTSPEETGEIINTKEAALKYRLLNESDDKPFESRLDQAGRMLYVYLPLKGGAEGQPVFLAKLSFYLGDIQEALIDVYKPAMLSIILVIIATMIVGLLMSKGIIGPIRILNEGTKVVAQGNLERRIYIDTDDELQELAETFNEMTVALIRMKERAENANPLTKLPGNIVIREGVEQRLRENKKFVVIHTDLNNFKAFNDKYGLAKGDEAIKINADVLKEAVEKNGNKDDLLGHEGGDDFVLITTPEKAAAITGYVAQEFDKRVRKLYSTEDLAQGFIISKSREGEVKKFPLMCISMAGATNAHRAISSYVEVTNITAEVKKKAKAQEKSVFVLDQRKDEKT